ncbi:MAG: UDP-N-acetylmuramoyl-tripeptide--D-alanyl-D-alanine ligase [Anaerolineae bacterium]|nr:UDP-N-acetylmuramoyl-tripeptide--D-alanyl-D-alanine ligase [Anaerolineae bacterium]
MTGRPKSLTLADVIAALTGGQSAPEAGPAVGIRSVVIDSRLATEGSLFVALRGEQHDGHDFVAQAIANGAAAVIAERPADPALCQPLDLRQPWGGQWQVEPGRPVCLVVPEGLTALQQAAAYWRRQHNVSVIGITGSVGKTISKETIAEVVRRRYRTLKSEGNYNNEIGLPLTLLHLTSEHEQAVLEMGMYNLGEIAQLAQIALPRIGVVTNVGPTHLERLGTIERIAQAKAELPEALPSASEGGVAILNSDDERVRAMAAVTRARVFTYGLHPDADLWAGDIESHGLEGIRFSLHFGDQAVYAQAPLLGRHSVHTALCAAAVALVLGLSWEEIIAGLHDQPNQLRLAAVPGPCRSTILDDTYNASPASSIAALNLLAELSGRKVAVLGDMYELGAYTEEGHRIVGRRVREVVDLLVTVGPLGQMIGEEAREAGMAGAAIHQVGTNAEAAALVRTLVQPGDMILIKGSRGLKMEQIVAELTQPGIGRSAQNCREGAVDD